MAEKQENEAIREKQQIQTHIYHVISVVQSPEVILVPDEMIFPTILEGFDMVDACAM